MIRRFGYLLVIISVGMVDAMDKRTVSLDLEKQGILLLRANPQINSNRRLNVHLDTEDDSSAIHKFELFIRRYNKIYTNETERAMRFKFFKESLKQIESLQREELGSAIYAVNEHSDLSCEEYSYQFNTGFPKRQNKRRLDLTTARVDPSLENENQKDPPLPKRFSWATTGVVPIAKNTGRCGACYAATTVEAANILYSARYEKMLNLSMQQIIDCTFDSRPGGNHGCNGGWVDNSFDYMQTTGLVENRYYPWKGSGDICKVQPEIQHYKIKDYHEKEASWLHTTEKFMKKAVLKSPVVVEVNSAALRFYEAGIMRAKRKKCSKSINDANHSLLVLGYGLMTEIIKNKVKETPYWICRNNFGPDWGEFGNVRIYMGDNVCGIGNYLIWIEI